MDLFSTITSSVFSEVVIVFENSDTDDLFRCRLFIILRDMYEVKPFCLVFSLEIWEGDRECTTERLKGYIEAETAKGGLEFLLCPPAIVFNTRAARDRWA